MILQKDLVGMYRLYMIFVSIGHGKVLSQENYGSTMHRSPLTEKSAVSITSYTRAFGDGPRNFEPWSRDLDETRAGTRSPNYHTSGRTFQLSIDLTCPTRRVLSGTGLDLVTRQATIRCLYHSATAAACLTWGSNPAPTAPQSVSLTTIPDEQLLSHFEFVFRINHAWDPYCC
ncbi:hypothetical protein TNCV_2427691 [Trichonephila clavipes]|nr:hypothetical protein TNCV_2427691 [Trichonephila clavipes]